MKQDKVMNIILLIVNVVLAAVCVVLYIKTDRTEPRFVIQPAEIIYTPGMDTTVLYDGIEAYDECDGELTDKVVIEKMVENREENTVIIYYAVSDAAGNTAKFSKLFQAQYPVEVSVQVNEAGRENQTVLELEQNRTSQGETDMTGAEADFAGDKTDMDESSGEDGADGESQDGDDSEDDVSEDDEDEQTDGQDGEEADAGADAAKNRQEAEEAPPEPVVKSGAPELVFRTTDVTVDAGANVPWTEIISTLRDDKDDYATLYYNLHVGQYNRNKAGTYTVNVYTEDSDGNRSTEVPVTITVR